jgi:hypothetical protein
MVRHHVALQMGAGVETLLVLDCNVVQQHAAVSGYSMCAAGETAMTDDRYVRMHNSAAWPMHGVTVAAWHCHAHVCLVIKQQQLGCKLQKHTTAEKKQATQLEG